MRGVAALALILASSQAIGAPSQNAISGAVTCAGASGFTTCTITTTNPEALLVGVGHPDGITGLAVACDGESLTNIATYNQTIVGASPGSLTWFLLASGANSGTYACVPTWTGGGGVAIRIIALDALTTLELNGSALGFESAAATDPSSTLSIGTGDSYVAMAWASEEDGVADVGPIMGWTSPANFEADNGSDVYGFYTYDTVADDDVSCGVTQTGEDFAALCIAIREVPSATNRVPNLRQRGLR